MPVMRCHHCSIQSKRPQPRQPQAHPAQLTITCIHSSKQHEHGTTLQMWDKDEVKVQYGWEEVALYTIDEQIHFPIICIVSNG